MLKKIFGFLMVIIGAFLVIRVARVFWFNEEGLISPRAIFQFGDQEPDFVQVKNLEKYAFDQLGETRFKPGSVRIGRLLEETNESWAYQFFYQAGTKQVSGRLDLPNMPGIYPVVIMLRGYADKEGYFSGSGTHRVAAEFARCGYITLAPDFIGFGDSSEEDEDILLNRFRRPETVLYLLASLEEINEELSKIGLGDRQLASERIFIWGHSNGGQIALSVLEITGRLIPASLWAPVGKGFPESVLQFASELDDEGKLVIERMSRFEQNYDSARYSIASYWDRIKAPVQIQQGSWDSYVKKADTDILKETLVANGVEVVYTVYPRADHNLKQVWDEAVAQDLAFFSRY